MWGLTCRRLEPPHVGLDPVNRVQVATLSSYVGALKRFKRCVVLDAATREARSRSATWNRNLGRQAWGEDLVIAARPVFRTNLM